jgi:4-methyl-5(b-hydroxyethyl)-thiazole monophosphate biosynthesis
MKKVLVPIANGSEEIESVCIIDTLRRAGADVTGALAAQQHLFCGGCAQLDSCAVASVEATREVTCSRSVRILADALITDCLSSVYDLIALPGPPPHQTQPWCTQCLTPAAPCSGGMPGAERLRDSDPLKELLTQQKQSGRLYAAVCASPGTTRACPNAASGGNSNRPPYTSPPSAVVFASHGLVGTLRQTHSPALTRDRSRC